jgi:hypothetical protein
MIPAELDKALGECEAKVSSVVSEEVSTSQIWHTE